MPDEEWLAWAWVLLALIAVGFGLSKIVEAMTT